MQTNLQDRLSIGDLMTGWIHRDLAHWDELQKLFHEDGAIEVTWFEGRASEFIDGSIRMGESNLRTKHFIAAPIIAFNGNRAVVETNAIIVAENVVLNLGCESHNRFYDLVEKRNGVWKIVKRQSIYDMGFFTFPCGLAEINKVTVERYPREYAPLAYLLDRSGFPVNRTFATKGSELEKTMKTDGQKWLTSWR